MEFQFEYSDVLVYGKIRKMSKICNTCNTERTLNHYSLDKRFDRYSAMCKPCANAKRKQARQSPEVKEKETKQRAAYRAKPETKALKKAYGEDYRSRPGFAEHSKEYQAEWYKNNRETKLKQSAENDKHRRQIDPQFRLRKALRSRIADAVKNGTKSDHSLNLIGCNIDYLKTWIEYQFDDNMSWDNCGTYWHIDHVKPCASFDLTIAEEQRKCFSWTNVQPLEKMENLSKRDKIDEHLIKWHKNMVEEFLKGHPLKIE